MYFFRENNSESFSHILRRKDSGSAHSFSPHFRKGAETYASQGLFSFDLHIVRFTRSLAYVLAHIDNPHPPTPPFRVVAGCWLMLYFNGSCVTRALA